MRTARGLSPSTHTADSSDGDGVQESRDIDFVQLYNIPHTFMSFADGAAEVMLSRRDTDPARGFDVEHVQVPVRLLFDRSVDAQRRLRHLALRTVYPLRLLADTPTPSVNEYIHTHEVTLQPLKKVRRARRLITVCGRLTLCRAAARSGAHAVL